MLSVGHVAHELDYRFSRGNELDYWTLEYLCSGQVVIRAATGWGYFRAPAVAIVPPRTSYSLEWAGGAGEWSEYYAIFDLPSRWNALLSWPLQTHGLGALHLSDSTVAEEVESALQSAWEMQRSARAQRQALTFNALEKAVLALDEINPARGYLRRDTRIEEALAFIAQHYAQPLSLPVLARQVYLSPSRFAHLFKTQIKLAPMQYLEQYRLERAAEKLLIGHGSIEQIAAACGFPNAFHFSTRFRRQFGQPPSRYRRNPR